MPLFFLRGGERGEEEEERGNGWSREVKEEEGG